MQSQGSTSSQPSFDSLSSSDSLLFSDSEQAEDDADVFLTDGSSSSSSVIIGGIGRAAAKGDRSLESPASQWTCDGFTDKEEEEESYTSGRGRKEPHRNLGHATRQAPKSEGDLLFAHKCAELHGFVRPLLELLNGLKTGRFDRGLSSFQQSVAMDRIQRIVGVLQRPHSGEKYLSTLLQVEAMLKLWFPHIPMQPVSTSPSNTSFLSGSLQDTSSPIPPHKHRDQLHIPVKKRRLSWTGTDSPTPSPVLYKCPRLSSEDRRARGHVCEAQGRAPPSLGPDASPASADAPGNSQLNQDTSGRDNAGQELGSLAKYKAGHSSEPNLTWVHVAPILSPRKACPSHQGAAAAAAGGGETQPVAAAPHPGRQGSPATQDSAVSSTTPNKLPRSTKKPSRCQSQPAAAPQGESAEAPQSQNQSHVTSEPLPRACPASVET